MPNRDGRGPEGKGPKTGRGLGRCGENIPRDELKGTGRGLGLGPKSGRGRGMGLGRGLGRGREE